MLTAYYSEQRLNFLALASITCIDIFMTRSIRPGIAILDSDLRFVMVNSELAQINGVPVEAHFGKHLRDVLGEASRPLEKHFESIFERRESVVSFDFAAKIPGRQTSGQWAVTYFPGAVSESRVTAVAAFVVEIKSGCGLSPDELAVHNVRDSTQVENPLQARQPHSATDSHVSNAAECDPTTEIENVARIAGFERVNNDPGALAFTRGKVFLIVNADATWTCYAAAAGIKKTVRYGYSSDSLLGFLLETDRSGT